MKMKTNKFMTYALSAMLLAAVMIPNQTMVETVVVRQRTHLMYGELKAQSRRVIICCSMRISLKTKKEQ